MIVGLVRDRHLRLLDMWRVILDTSPSGAEVSWPTQNVARDSPLQDPAALKKAREEAAKQIEKRQNEVGEGDVLLVLAALAVEHTGSHAFVDHLCFFVACVSCVLYISFACSNASFKYALRASYGYACIYIHIWQPLCYPS